MVQVVEGREQRARPVSQPSCCWNTGSSCTGDWSTHAADAANIYLAHSLIHQVKDLSLRLSLLLSRKAGSTAAHSNTACCCCYCQFLPHSLSQSREGDFSISPTANLYYTGSFHHRSTHPTHLSCWRKAGSAATPQHVLLLPLSRERSDCLVHPCLVQCCACLPVCLSWQCAWLWCQLCNKWLNCLWCLSSPAFCC